MGTQPKLPGTLPTPAAAKAALRAARETLAAKSRTLEGLKDQEKRAKAEQAAAAGAIDEAERDLLAAAADSPEDVEASARARAGYERDEKAARALQRVGEALGLARTERDDALRALRGARGDVRAVYEGRRK